MTESEDIVDRLQQQAQSGSHVWVDVMLLLLEAAKEIKRVRSLYMEAANELDDLKQTRKFKTII